jgi:hypothetical protein
LWNDHHQPGLERMGLPVILGHDEKGRDAIDDLWGAVSDD